MWKARPLAVAMPAASWPRCCRSCSASYSSWLTGEVPETPTIPHMLDSYAFGPRVAASGNWRKANASAASIRGITSDSRHSGSW